MKKIKISIVSYLNTLPFLYGIANSDVKEEIEMSLDVPSESAAKLCSGAADAGLMPVTEIQGLKKSYHFTDYCIGAKGAVGSVLLLSDVEIDKIKTVLLDYQSCTSSELLKILAFHYWKIYPELKNTQQGYEKNIRNETAGLVIGNRALICKQNFKYAYDLSEAWYQMTALPFVFACWVSRKRLNEAFIKKFNAALKSGIEHIDEAIAGSSVPEIPDIEKAAYLKKNISYIFDDEKKKALHLFNNYSLLPG